MPDNPIKRAKTRLIPMEGLRFGSLTVIERGPNLRDGTVRWRCLCDCGRVTLPVGTNLRKGGAVSCGKGHHKPWNLSHGEANAVNGRPTPEFINWTQIKNRCLNTKDRAYPTYGGRGITICDEWKNDYAAFLAFMGRRPTLSHSVDRIDNDGNYEPGNVRWATQSQQMNNTSINRRVLYRGRMMTIAEIARENGVPYNPLYRKVFLQRQSIEEALA